MKITCHTDKHLPNQINEAVISQANTRLNRFAPLITHVHATLSDENGPKGGVDIRCQLSIKMKRGVKVQIRETADTVGIALSRAFDRASRTIARRMRRVRQAQRVRVANAEILPFGFFYSS